MNKIDKVYKFIVFKFVVNLKKKIIDNLFDKFQFINIFEYFCIYIGKKNSIYENIQVEMVIYFNRKNLDL